MIPQYLTNWNLSGEGGAVMITLQDYMNAKDWEEDDKIVKQLLKERDAEGEKNV